MKKKFVLLLTVIMIFSGFSTISALEDDVKIQLDGDIVDFGISPIIENNRTLVPVRALFEKMGAKVDWDNEKRVVIIDSEYLTINLPIDSNTALVYRKFDFSGIPEKIELDVPAKIVKGSSFVPARFVAETLGAKVDWDGDNRTVIIQGKYFERIPGYMLDKPLKFTVINPNEVELSKELMEWYNSNTEEESYSLKIVDGISYIKVSAGIKPTGGYGLTVDGLYDLESGSVYVESTLTSPTFDDMVTMAFTYPKTLISVDSEIEISEVKGGIMDNSKDGRINQVETNINFKEVDSSISDNDDLKKWVETNKKNQGVHYLKEDNTIYVLISAGEKPTSGYSIDISSITKVNSDTAYVNAKLISPKEGMMNLQVLTYPYKLVAIDSESIIKVDGSISNLINPIVSEKKQAR